MEFEEEEMSEPVSPSGLYFNSSTLSIFNLAVLESDVPIDDSPAISLLENVFIPINPRFSSVMVTDINGEKQWKKVEVNVKDHINIPIFPAGLSPKSYDKYLDDYLSSMSMELLPQNKPLWNIHIVKYPTSNASGTLIFKLHHALGDGYSLMGALLSCLTRADNPSLPLTFPTFHSNTKSEDENHSIFKLVSQGFYSVFNAISDFSWSFLMSTVVEDDRTSIRSANFGVDLRPITISTITFSLQQISEIKAKLGVTVNDVLTGIIFMGIRLYMQETMSGLGKTQSTALVLLNTREVGMYKSVDDMVKKRNGKSLWGNQFAFLHVSLPEIFMDIKSSNPIEFVWKAHEIIQKKRSSFGFHLTGGLLEMMRKFRGSEATAKLIHKTLTNSSMTISNMIGPVEQMALANHKISGLYFMVVGSPQSLTITMMSYMGKLRIAFGTEKGYIDAPKFKSCIERSYEMIFNETMKGNTK